MARHLAHIRDQNRTTQELLVESIDVNARSWVLCNPLVRKREHPLVHQILDLEVDLPSFLGTGFSKKSLVPSDLVSQSDQNKVGCEQSINGQTCGA